MLISFYCQDLTLHLQGQMSQYPVIWDLHLAFFTPWDIWLTCRWPIWAVSWMWLIH